MRDIRKLMQEKHRLNTPERVVFVDRVPQRELLRWTAGATLGVIPYEYVGLNHYYCTPNKLWEYPAAGVPVLVSPFPEMRKIVSPNDLGWFLDDPIEARQVAEFIGSLTSEHLAEKRANCAGFIRNDNWQLYERPLLELYERLS